MNVWINRFAWCLEKFIMLFVGPIIWVSNKTLPSVDRGIIPNTDVNTGLVLK